jgi:V/A-type H+-transporting ATPase subunit A
VTWNGSFSRDAASIGRWYAEATDPDWAVRRDRVVRLLADADRLRDLAELVGTGALPGRERVILLGGRLLREAVLQQNALSANDAYSSPGKTAALCAAVLQIVDACDRCLESGVDISAVEAADFAPVLRAALECPPDAAEAIAERAERVLCTLRALT